MVGLGAVLFFGRVIPLLSGGSRVTPEFAGYVVGSIVGALLLGLAVCWFFARVLLKRGRVLTPWITVIAVVVLLVNVGQGIDTGTEPAAHPIDHYVAIESPYRLRPASPEEQAGFAPLAETLAEDGDVEIRRILDGSTVVGFLVVADAGVSDPERELREVQDGAESNPEAVTRLDRIGERAVLVASGSDGTSFTYWMEPPYVLIVYGADEASVRLLAEAVMAQS